MVVEGGETDLASSRETRGVPEAGEAAGAAAAEGVASLDGEGADVDDERRAGDILADEDEVLVGAASMSGSCEIDMLDFASWMRCAADVVMGLFVMLREMRGDWWARIASAMVATPWSDMLHD